MKTNFVNIEDSLRFLFQNKKYVSSSYHILRDESGDFDDLKESELIGTFAGSENLGLLLRFYDLHDIKCNGEDSELVKKLPFYDILLHFRKSRNLRSFNATNDGITATLDGDFFVDMPQEKIREIYGHQIVYVLGFCGSNYWCQFFSPLVGFKENEPKTWEIFTSSNHRITPTGNLNSKSLFEKFEN